LLDFSKRLLLVGTGAPLILAEPQMEGEPPLEDIFQINRVRKCFSFIFSFQQRLRMPRI